MVKIKHGRIEGMSSYSVDELFVMAEGYESKISDPNNTDNSKWLKRRADKLRVLAIEKEKAKEHKANQ